MGRSASDKNATAIHSAMRAAKGHSARKSKPAPSLALRRKAPDDTAATPNTA